MGNKISVEGTISKKNFKELFDQYNKGKQIVIYINLLYLLFFLFILFVINVFLKRRIEEKNFLIL